MEQSNKQEDSSTKEDKSEKKKLIRVAVRRSGDSGYMYDNSAFTFAYVSNPANGRTQATGAMTCREHFNATLWKAINKAASAYHDISRDAPVDLERLRILIMCTPSGSVTVEQFKSKLFSGKACLNLLEKINNWKPSAITSVKHDKCKNAWLLTGSEKWMSQPQLLSLATWILRLSATFGPIDASSYDAFEENLKTIKDKTPQSAKTSDVATYLPKFWDKIYVLLKYNDEIWGHMNFDKAWKINTDKNFGVLSGMVSFVMGEANYSEDVKKASEKFKKLCKEHLPRKKE